MNWYLCGTLSIVILLISILLSIYIHNSKKTGQFLKPYNILFTGVFLSVFVLLFPVFRIMTEGETTKILESILFDFIATLQVFTINLGGSFILENITANTMGTLGLYSSFASVLFVLAPILTLGVIISLFNNTLAIVKFYFNYSRDIYVFSELNEKSLSLAQSIEKTHKSAVLMFTGINHANEDAAYHDYRLQARNIGAILLHNEVVSVRYDRHSTKSRIVFFLISNDEEKNIIQAAKLIENYGTRENTEAFVFSSDVRGEILAAGYKESGMKIRRVNVVKSLIYRYLYENGNSLFANAVEGDNEKEINIVIVGLGTYGTELIKALIWYCQMDGYYPCFDVFDADDNTEERFSALCPEIMDKNLNGKRVPGESQYTVRIHSGIDAGTKSFVDAYSKLNRTSCVFVCAGDDVKNINLSTNIRMLSERIGCKPDIKTIIYSSEEQEILRNAVNFRGDSYNIEVLGEYKEIYSEKILVGSDLEKLALERHLKWGKEDEFWKYEYNYSSSMAAAIHMQARIDCNIPGADKKETDLTQAERDLIERLEHRRWNSFMRTCGYVYSGSRDKNSRNDLGKMHQDLVVFELLSEEDMRKDSSVGTK